MLDIFSTFETTNYTFVAYGQGSIYGNKSLATFVGDGIFKLRRGVSRTANGEVATSTATLHIRPTEGFLATYKPLEGHGIIINDNEYRIVGVTEGFNFSANVLEHITLTLQIEEHTDG